MMKGLLAIVLASLLSGCITITGTSLLKGVSRQSDISEVEVIETIDIYETQLYCTQYAPAHQILLNCITNACFVSACAIPFVDAEGVIRKCYIYLWADVDFLRQHEIEHCTGLADLLY